MANIRNILLVFILMLPALCLLVFLYFSPHYAPSGGIDPSITSDPFLMDNTSPTYTPPLYTENGKPIHPYLLFHDISETPGYKLRSEEPWKGWEKQVISSADDALSLDFSDPDWQTSDPEINWVSARGQYAMNLGLAYQITKDQKYAKKAKEALINIGVGEVPANPGMMLPREFRAMSLLGYCPAYDWIQPTLDGESDDIIRDKLAVLADTVYGDLNWNGTNRDYITFDDYQGQAYPTMGIAAVTLYDYTNPNGLPLTSTPEDWKKVATDYLFVNDELHGYNRSLISCTIDLSGKDLSGAYKSYYIDDFVWWAQVYSHFYGRNFFDDYPITKDIFISEIWETLPNHYSSNYGTNGNMKYVYHRGIANLLDEANRSYVLNHDNRIEDSELLPYSGVMDHIYYQTELPDALLYLVYGNYSSLPQTYPQWTSHLDNQSVYQVFRKDWSDDSDWLSLITFSSSAQAKGYRVLAHHDQLSFEYYAKGDLLLADAGEDRNVLDMEKGRSEVHHNVIAIEDPRSPFGPSSWAGSDARGIFKGSSDILYTPANVKSLARTPWIEMADANVTISSVMDTLDKGMPLSSPIAYDRLILYPEKDYFIVIDRLDGEESWVYRNIFRPTSLSITPTQDSTANSGVKVGHVNGALTVANSTIDWLSYPYKEEHSTGIITNSLKWSTVNPYGNSVELQLYTVPASEVTINKHIGRIAGYGYLSEVFSPVVSFRSLPTDDLYRVTVLLPGYDTEASRAPAEIPVDGIGNAVKVTSAGYEDYIYAGTGASSFGPFSTDADEAFVRKSDGGLEYAIINGTYLNYDHTQLISTSSKVDYLALKQQSNGYAISVKSIDDLFITLCDFTPGYYQITRDGEEYTDWRMMEDGTMRIHTGNGEYLLDVMATLV